MFPLLIVLERLVRKPTVIMRVEPRMGSVDCRVEERVELGFDVH